MLPFRITSPPVGFIGWEGGKRTVCPEVSLAVAASSANVRPVTVIWSPWRWPDSKSHFATNGVPPA